MKKNIFITLIIFICFLISPIAKAQKDDYQAAVAKINLVMSNINQYYVDSVSFGRLVEQAIKAMIKELDPHSSYMTKKEIDKANEPLVGHFDGIGVTFQIYNDTVLVLSTISDGPATIAGVVPGDRILKINNEDVTGKKITNDFIVNKIRGERNTSVELTLYSRKDKKVRTIKVIRDKIPIYSIEASFMVSKETGYIRLTRFSSRTLHEFNSAILVLKLQGMSNLILDLRGNSGGYLQTAIDLSDEFLPKGRLIVYTQGLHSPRFEYTSTSKGSWIDGRLALLVDENSASASEILAGAIQDWDRGILIGRRTFGKGLVQRPYYLQDGSAVRLTTARYYTPTGRCIQKTYKNGIDDYNKEINRRIQHGELITADSIKFPDSLKYYTPNKRTVYGGGGIMPDIFIPVDTTRESAYYKELLNKNLPDGFTIQQFDCCRDSFLMAYPTFEIFQKYFDPNQLYVKKFISYANDKGVSFNEEGYKQSEKLLNSYLKALLAKYLFENSRYFEVMSTVDDAIQKALMVISDKTYFKKNKIQDK